MQYGISAIYFPHNANRFYTVDNAVITNFKNRDLTYPILKTQHIMSILHLFSIEIAYEPRSTHIINQTTVRIQARIYPPHPLVCRKRRLNWAVLQMKPEKPRSRVTVGVTR
jgi:hypothetical protein